MSLPVRSARAWPGRGHGGASERPSPAARNIGYERMLCNAIGARLLVELRYDGEAAHRLFAPHALFRTDRSGMQVSGTPHEPAEQASDGEALEILALGRIRSLRITGEAFDPDPRFDRSSRVFEAGVICAV